MSDASLAVLFFALLALLACSAYLSASGTATLSLNRYRLRQLMKHRHKGALRAGELLNNADRLVGMILIGTTFVNVLASSLATLIALRLWGDAGIWIGTALLTIALLVLGEITPKTIAALHPEKVAYPSSALLVWLMKALQPLVWLVSSLSNLLVRLLRLHRTGDEGSALARDELRTVVSESGFSLSRQRHGMLLNAPDLDKVTVNDVMVPRNEVTGIDLEDDIDTILDLIVNTQHTRLPVYKKDLNNVIGILHMRVAVRLLKMEFINKAELLQLTTEAYFIPESTSLPTQLVNFQKQKQRIAIVVDEYGDVKGIVTLEDILEEIVGNFSASVPEDSADIHPQTDGSYLIDGGANIREINRALDWDLPTNGPKTLNGLLTEFLESIPEQHIGIRLPYHRAEIVHVKDNTIKTVRMWAVEPEADEHDSAEYQANIHD